MEKSSKILKLKINKAFKRTSLIAGILSICLLLSGTVISSGVNNGQAVLLDSLPIKDVTVSITETKKVIPCGTPIGIKMYCVGAVVVDTQEIKVNNQSICPAKDAGIKKGDIIKTANGKAVNDNSDLINAVNESKGRKIPITYIRNEKEYTVYVTPVNTNNNGDYKIGVWVRDSSAGIGTVTFYDPESGSFAALGHGICDVDTGNILPMSDGIPVNAVIDDVQKSTKGTVGCLIGHFTNDIKDGSIRANTQSGLYGYIDGSPVNNEPMEIASIDEIVCGKAQILSTISGDKPKYYDIEIESLNTSTDNHTKNFVIKVTDKELLDKTGGIVQGMSGSPIIQNGKLIGAVTHVFVNSPEKGYGIYAQNMLSQMNDNGV